MKQTIQIKYTCKLCGLIDRKLNIPARGVTEDLQPWMDNLALLIVHDHGSCSPRCRAQEITRLWIPLNKDASGEYEKSRIGAYVPPKNPMTQ